MIDPEIQYSMAKFEQSRRDKQRERHRAYFDALELDPLPHPAGDATEGSACCELEEAS